MASFGFSTSLPVHEDDDNEEARECLSGNEEERNLSGLSCSTAWDGINCWPATEAGNLIRRPCTQVMKFLQGKHLPGFAFRECSENGTWSLGSYTNYSECIEEANRLEEYEWDQKARIQEAVRYIVLSGSFISLFCLCATVYLFKEIRLRSERVALLVQLMAALIVKSTLFIIITGPTVTENLFEWNQLTWLCNLVVTCQLYASMVSNFWVVAHGHSLNKLVGLNGFGCQIPMQRVILACWGLPALPCITWFILMSHHYGNPKCWGGYDESRLIWLITAPLLLTIVAHLTYIFHIVFVLLSSLERSQFPNRLHQKWTATKITFTLFLMLGLNNIFFVVNPGGSAFKYYLFIQAICQSFQGTTISVICCILTKDVRRTIRKMFFSVCTCLGED